MAFQNILIVYSEKITEKHLKTIESVKQIVGGHKIVRADQLTDENFNQIDLVITIGGDGAFSRAANFIEGDISIIGINSEPESSEGALLSLHENEIEKLKEIIQGKFNFILRERLDVKINGKLLRPAAEAYFGSLYQYHTSRYLIDFNNKKEEQRSSGVLVTTGTGSSAWYKSIGGKPFPYSEKKLKFIVREPYFGDRIFKPTILEGEIEINPLILECKRYGNTVVVLDSNIVYNLNFGDKVEILPSNKQLKVIVK